MVFILLSNRKRFGKVDDLLNQNVKSGGVAILKDNDRYIYYLVTKEFTYNKPTYDSLTASLNAMKDHVAANNVKSVALPRIGCGIDGLEWEKVQAILHKVFSDMPIEMTVYTFK